MRHTEHLLSFWKPVLGRGYLHDQPPVNNLGSRVSHCLAGNISHTLWVIPGEFSRSWAASLGEDPWKLVPLFSWPLPDASFSFAILFSVLLQGLNGSHSTTTCWVLLVNHRAWGGIGDCLTQERSRVTHTDVVFPNRKNQTCGYPASYKRPEGIASTWSFLDYPLPSTQTLRQLDQGHSIRQCLTHGQNSRCANSESAY